MTDRRTKRAASITVQRYASAREADAHDLEFWAQLSDVERVLQAWRLSVELWHLRGDPLHEPRLSRSVTRLHRR